MHLSPIPSVVVLLLLTYFSLLFPLFVGILCLVLVLLFSTLCQSSFVIILRERERERERELVALLYLSSWCPVTVSVLWLFLAVRWVGLLCVIVVIPDHTYSLFR